MFAGKKLTYLVYHICARAVYEKHLNFQPLEAVSRYRDPQLQVAEILIRTLEIVCWLQKNLTDPVFLSGLYIKRISNGRFSLRIRLSLLSLSDKKPI